MRFAKGHGTENDFLILTGQEECRDLPPGLVARLCDRRAGIGADGVLRAVRTASPGTAASSAGPAGTQAQPEWFMDYRNADGSLAEMCGNGIRVFARYLIGAGLAAGPEFTVATRSGLRRVRTEPDGDISADMGPAIPLGPGRAGLGGRVWDGLRISVGNPHLACIVDEPLEKLDLSAAPDLDPVAFPEGGNLELVQLTGTASASMRVHERGSGETRSCGTGAVAAALAAARARGQDTGVWRITVPGG
ncbi:MAG: diaminopimelate epimerase, partial [Actinobacteria bacterium]|nr:diaminopimelate epimerase [Actinomycetota bacterium]